jgi:cellobiose dehydrogenase (acceptor)
MGESVVELPDSLDSGLLTGFNSAGGPTTQCTPAPATTYDYIVVGAGAGGIPVADKLSQAGHKVLLIEKGPPSTGRWNGTMRPRWLDGTGLTRFDVPGLCNQIWVDSAGIACTDTDQMAGCVLGGGTAVNAGLWWKVSPPDAKLNL